MAASRLAFRSLRSKVPAPSTFRHARPYSSTSSQTANTSNSSHVSHIFLAGLAGGAVSFAGGYTWYHFSGAKTAVNLAKSTKHYFEKTSKQFAESAPEPNEALQWLRHTATSYAAFIPGAKGYINSAFDDLDAIRNKHGDKVDGIVREAYNELKEVTKEKGMSAETALQVWEITQKHLKRIGDLAGDAVEDILNNHPEIKAKVGGNIDNLKALGDKYGPEAKKQVDQTWDQIRDIVKSGVSMDTASRIRSLIQEKTEKLQQLGDQAWKTGLEQAKPYLDKSPKVKELVEHNADQLKKGNVTELWQKVKDSIQSGNTESVEQYIKSAVDKAKSQGQDATGGLEQYFNMIPGAEKVVPTLSRLSEIGQKHGKEAEHLLKEAFEEIQQVLQKKVGEAEKLAEKAKKTGNE